MMIWYDILPSINVTNATQSAHSIASTVGNIVLMIAIVILGAIIIYFLSLIIGHLW